MKLSPKLVVFVDTNIALEVILKDDFSRKLLGSDEKLLMELVLKELLVDFTANQENENGDET